MHAELVVPGLLAAAQGARLPCAELLLARGRASRAERVSVERWLQEAFGLEGDLPAGALTALSRGEPADGFLARADPVHLQLMREHIVTVPGAALSVSREEAEALAAAINAHFAGRLEVRVADPVRWWARLAAPLELAREPALEHAGRALRPGATSAETLNTELQMLLHAHPVNEAREARGEPPVNGLWLWGGGAAPKDVQSPWQSVSADDPVALGLAQAAKSRGRALPASADAWLERLPEDGRQLLLLDGLPPAVALEQAWFAPLLAALRGGRIGMLTVHVPDSGVSFEAIRADLRRFWRRPRPLAEHDKE
ncbi:MAG TPA: hypothetical protein VNH80_00305 [Burkholderiales bacterium]|nr:hypothetical protein [Burkholderiales bacterium]